MTAYFWISISPVSYTHLLHWVEEEEMLDLTAIAQSSPGAVAVNASIILGYRIAGAVGALIAVLGTVLPPLIILSVISLFYTAFRENPVVNNVLRGMQAGVAAVICDVVISMGGNVVKEKDVLSICILLGAFVASYIWNVNVVLIVLVCGTLGAVRFLMGRRKKQGGAPS